MEVKGGKRSSGQTDQYLLRYGGSASGASSPPEEIKTDTGVVTRRSRNTTRGLRSRKARERRKELRTAKRRWARRKRREVNTTLVLASDNANQNGKKKRKWAQAQEPKEKWDWKEDMWIATLNVDEILRKGKREEVEAWMKKNNIGYYFCRKHMRKQTVGRQEGTTHGTSVGK